MKPLWIILADAFLSMLIATAVVFVMIGLGHWDFNPKHFTPDELSQWQGLSIASFVYGCIRRSE